MKVKTKPPCTKANTYISIINKNIFKLKLNLLVIALLKHHYA